MIVLDDYIAPELINEGPVEASECTTENSGWKYWLYNYVCMCVTTMSAGGGYRLGWKGLVVGGLEQLNIFKYWMEVTSIEPFDQLNQSCLLMYI